MTLLRGVPNIGISLAMGNAAGKAGKFVDYLTSLDINFEAVIKKEITKGPVELSLRAVVALKCPDSGFEASGSIVGLGGVGPRVPRSRVRATSYGFYS